ncbi:MAG: outer membrane protein assembly factor BamE [Pseudomonadota bacterium]
MRLFALLVVAFAASACVSVRSQHGYVLERGQTSLAGEVGLDTKESILAKYGEPSLIGAFDRNAWYYLASSEQTRAFFTPETTTRTVVAFRFDDDGVMTETEKYDIDDGNEINIVSRITPTRGKELNFWEQLLGNVGQLPAGIGGDGQVPGQ